MITGGSNPKFAKKSLGQNFLTDQFYIKKIVEAVEPKADETIIEIGPGRGALTEKLLETGAKVIAIELDRDLIEPLKKRFSGYSDFLLIEADVMETDLLALLRSFSIDQPVKLAANLPYYISTAILQKLIGERKAFSELVLMFQREVADRITADPSNSERGYLTVLIEAFFVVEKLFHVPPEAFRPQPKIWSSVVRLKQRLIETADPALFQKIVSAGFRYKRKTLFNNLRYIFQNASEMLAISGIDPARRAETLKLSEWVAITDAAVMLLNPSDR